MGLTGHIPFLVPFAPPGFKLRRQGNLTSGGFLDGAHWAYTSGPEFPVGRQGSG